MRRFAGLAVLMMAPIAAACSDDDGSGADTASVPVPSSAPAVGSPPPPTPSSAPVETSTPGPTSPATDPSTTLATAAPTTPASSSPPPATAADASGSLTARQLVEALAADELVGRDNGTAGSLAAQELLIGQLAEFAQPAEPTKPGDDGFRQTFAAGTNVLAVIPGGDLAAEWVVLGAHYDGLGEDCRIDDPADTICNGATDNATGVAVVVSAARAVAEAGTTRRSVLVALWDAEEDGLLGSAAYLQAPIVPVEHTIAYINFDNQGSNLLPSGGTRTVMVGAETGGAALVDAATAATASSTLRTSVLSLVFGQGRSDHANFAAAGVPSVFFTDATGPCYHTPSDDVDVVDFAKLDQQIVTAAALLRDLVATETPPQFDAMAPLATFDDAVTMLEVMREARPYFSRFGADGQAASEQYLAALEAIVDAGSDAFDDASIGTVLGGAAAFVENLTTGECDGFLL